MYSAFHKIFFFRILTIGICTVLNGCGSSKTESKQQSLDSQNSSSEILAQAVIKQDSVVDGKKLTDVAGQATVPASVEVNDQKQMTNAISKNAKALVGRYHVKISCEDRFAMCEKGNSEFIINLLPDGTAHRTFVYMGKITYEKNEIKTNRSNQKNTWTYDEKSHEIIVHRLEGNIFFYKVDANKNLMMDIDKILNGTEENKLYFQQHHTAPTKAYVLERFEN